MMLLEINVSSVFQIICINSLSLSLSRFCRFAVFSRFSSVSRRGSRENVDKAFALAVDDLPFLTQTPSRTRALSRRERETKIAREEGDALFRPFSRHHGRESSLASR